MRNALGKCTSRHLFGSYGGLHAGLSVLHGIRIESDKVCLLHLKSFILLHINF